MKVIRKDPFVIASDKPFQDSKSILSFLTTTPLFLYTQIFCTYEFPFLTRPNWYLSDPVHAEKSSGYLT